MTLQELKTLVYAKLKNNSTIPVFNMQNISNTYPCIVYSLLGTGSDTRNRDNFILELNYWNDSLDDSELLTSCEQIKSAFNYGWETGETGFYQSFLEWFSEIPDIETNISRIQQRYLLKVR